MTLSEFMYNIFITNKFRSKSCLSLYSKIRIELTIKLTEWPTSSWNWINTMHIRFGLFLGIIYKNRRYLHACASRFTITLIFKIIIRNKHTFQNFLKHSWDYFFFLAGALGFFSALAPAFGLALPLALALAAVFFGCWNIDISR